VLRAHAREGEWVAGTWPALLHEVAAKPLGDDFVLTGFWHFNYLCCVRLAGRDTGKQKTARTKLK
jgi:hypothetical protein